MHVSKTESWLFLPHPKHLQLQDLSHCRCNNSILLVVQAKCGLILYLTSFLCHSIYRKNSIRFHHSIFRTKHFSYLCWYHPSPNHQITNKWLPVVISNTLRSAMFLEVRTWTNTEQGCYSDWTSCLFHSQKSSLIKEATCDSWFYVSQMEVFGLNVILDVFMSFFWMRLTFESVDWIKQTALSEVGGVAQSADGLNKAKKLKR